MTQRWRICQQCKKCGFDPWVGKIPWIWQPLQYSYLENSMDRGAWWATVHGATAHGATKSWTWLNNWTQSIPKILTASNSLVGIKKVYRLLLGKDYTIVQKTDKTLGFVMKTAQLHWARKNPDIQGIQRIPYSSWRLLLEEEIDSVFVSRNRPIIKGVDNWFV